LWRPTAKVEISALLTTRNRAHQLLRVLGALRDQILARSRFEIIAVDDGSTDDNSNLLHHYAQSMHLRIFRKRHSALAEAKNLGVFAARSQSSFSPTTMIWLVRTSWRFIWQRTLPTLILG
jgi:glycosyltransferase involved in cell wall biosynthesis